MILELQLAKNGCIISNILIERITATLSGKHTSRLAISGVPETSVSDSLVVTGPPIAGAWTALAEALADTLTDLSGNQFTPVLRQTSSGGVALPDPVFVPISSGTYDRKCFVRKTRRSVPRGAAT